MSEGSEDAKVVWARDQRALARALGLSIEEWLLALEAAGRRTTGLTAAVIGAAMARGLGLSVLDGLDGPALAQRGRTLIDPTPPRVENPVLKEAIRRAVDQPIGRGLALLSGDKKPKDKVEKVRVPTPRRGTGSLGDSANFGTADAPGAGPAPQRPTRRQKEEEE